MPGSISLLKTNLTPPTLCDDVLLRPRLLEMIQPAHKRALTLVCAPAGSGKTTLVVQWLAESPETARRQTAWLSLDNESDNSKIDLWLTQLLAAIQGVFPRALKDIDLMMRAQTLPSTEVLTSQLINDIAELPGDFMLVIEDYHLVQSPAIHEMMARLLLHCPPQLHLIVTSRTEPPLHLNTLRARGQLIEVRQGDLRFDARETASFLERAMEATPSPEVVRLLSERTEGWAVGLRLAAISARGDHLGDLATNLRDTQRHVIGYLTDEVLARQSDEIKEFLLRTAILDRVSASSAATLFDGMEASSAEEHIQELVRSNLFLLSADSGQGVWYRYHALFRMFLKARLDSTLPAETIRDLHLRAARWFAEQGLVEEALRHALAGDDEEYAADLVEAGVMRALNDLDRALLNHYLDLLPPAVIERRPGLLLARGWALRWSLQMAAVPAILERARHLLAQEPRERGEQFSAHLRAFDSVVEWGSAEPERAIASATEALNGLPTDSYFLRGVTEDMLLFSLQMQGNAEAARQRLSDSHARHGNAFDSYSMRLAIGDWAIPYLEGWLEQSALAGNILLTSSRLVNMPLGIAWGHYFSGLTAFEQARFDGALQHFASLTEISYAADLGSVVDGLLGTALIYEWSGRLEESEGALEAAMDHAVRANSPHFAAEVSICRARCALARGDIEIAFQFLPQPILPEVRRRPFYTIGNPEITAAHILIARGKRDDLPLARKLVDAIAGFVKRTNARHSEADVHLLDALYYQRIERFDAAESALLQALQMGAPRGALRTFLEMARPLLPMLRQQLALGVEPHFIQRVLEGLPEPNQPRASGVTTLIKPLTNRELDVLELLVGRYSNQEIADALVVAPNTIRAHLVRLFEKLGAENRRDAVIKAREYGLIP